MWKIPLEGTSRCPFLQKSKTLPLAGTRRDCVTTIDSTVFAGVPPVSGPGGLRRRDGRTATGCSCPSRRRPSLGPLRWVYPSIWRTCRTRTRRPAGAALLAVIAVLTSRWGATSWAYPWWTAPTSRSWRWPSTAPPAARQKLVVCVLLSLAREGVLLPVGAVDRRLLPLGPPAEGLSSLLVASTALTWGVRHGIDGRAGTRSSTCPPCPFPEAAVLPSGVGELFSLFGYFVLVLLVGGTPRSLGAATLAAVAGMGRRLAGRRRAHAVERLGRMGDLSVPVIALACSLMDHPPLFPVGGGSAARGPLPDSTWEAMRRCYKRRRGTSMKASTNLRQGFAKESTLSPRGSTPTTREPSYECHARISRCR